jgi:hypothetical protein
MAHRTPPYLMEEESSYSQGVVKVLPDKLRAIKLHADGAWRVLEHNPELAFERLHRLQTFLNVFHREALEGDTVCDGGVHLRHEDLERRVYGPVQKAISWLERALNEGTTTGGVAQQLRIIRKWLRGDFERDELPR